MDHHPNKEEQFRADKESILLQKLEDGFNLFRNLILDISRLGAELVECHNSVLLSVTKVNEFIGLEEFQLPVEPGLQTIESPDTCDIGIKWEANYSDVLAEYQNIIRNDLKFLEYLYIAVSKMRAYYDNLHPRLTSLISALEGETFEETPPPSVEPGMETIESPGSSNLGIKSKTDNPDALPASGFTSDLNVITMDCHGKEKQSAVDKKILQLFTKWEKVIQPFRNKLEGALHAMTRIRGNLNDTFEITSMTDSIITSELEAFPPPKAGHLMTAAESALMETRAGVLSYCDFLAFLFIIICVIDIFVRMMDSLSRLLAKRA